MSKHTSALTIGQVAETIGCTREQIVEGFMQMALYAGLPAALNALFMAREIFERGDREGDAACAA